jgi:hypothetical protein
LPILSIGVRLPEVSGPFDDIPWASPVWSELSISRPGSALGLSQPLSGFLAVPSFAALFRAATVSGILSSERSPRPGSRASLEAAGSLAVIHRCAETRSLLPCHRLFHRRPRFHAVAWIPRRLWNPFPRTEVRFPGSLGDKRRNRLVPPASPASKLSSPCRVRSQWSWVAPPPLVDALLSFCPSEAFPSAPWVLEPTQALELEHVPQSEDSGSRPKGPQPLWPGETFQST